VSPAPLSHETFKTAVTIITFAAACWALFDIIKMRKLRGKDPANPLVRDERFGYYMGIVIGLFTISGLLRYQGIL
jgi:hypothetical protein